MYAYVTICNTVFLENSIYHLFLFFYFVETLESREGDGRGEQEREKGERREREKEEREGRDGRKRRKTERDGRKRRKKGGGETMCHVNQCVFGKAPRSSHVKSILILLR